MLRLNHYGGDVSESLWSDEPIKPIKHIRVIDFSVLVTGPYLTRILAQYGAEVVRVENKFEERSPRGVLSGEFFNFLNQGKKSLCIDFTTVEGRDIVRSLASEADIFVENHSSGLMEKLGLSYADLASVNPNLIYLSLRTLHGNLSEKVGYDQNAIATSGVGEWFLEGGGLDNTSLGDILGGVYAALTKLLIHLVNPDRRGMHLISSADESFRSLYLPKACEAVRKTENQLSGRKPRARFYHCQDGQWISFQAIENQHWEKFCETTQHHDWKHRGDDLSLNPDIEKLFRSFPASHWEIIGSTHEVPLIRMISWSEAISNAQQKNQLISDPLAWAGFAPNQDLGPSPKIGQDSFSVLHGLGFSNEKISQLMAKEIVIQTK
ncbi:CoA transferase [bacterium]|nr:CoA transferase [bacterium]